MNIYHEFNTRTKNTTKKNVIGEKKKKRGSKPSFTCKMSNCGKIYG